jgi:hypothetical protein
MGAQGHHPVSFLVFRLVFSIFLGLGLGLPSAFSVVEVEAGRAEVWRDGEGEVESRLALLKASMLLSLLRRPDLSARYARLKGEAAVFLPVVPRSPSPDRVGRHASVASRLSSSMVKSSVTVAESPHRQIRGQRPSFSGDAAERAGVVILWCLGPGASSGFGGTSLSSFCVKWWFFFCCFPEDCGSSSVLPAVGFDGGGSCFPSNPTSAGGRCLFNVQGASRWRFRMSDLAAS